MYLPLPGYSKREIKDLYTVYLPPAPPRNKIAGWELPKEEQHWRRLIIPKWYEDRREEEKEHQEEERKLVRAGVLDRVSHFDRQCENYRRQQWVYRIFGFWFMNNGEPVYLTGEHWMYLQWTKLDHPENDGYPLFYENQMDRFYFRRLCVEDPFCLGYFIVGPRGFGKSSEESACQVNNMTMPPHNRHAAIQSKSQEDAKQVVFKEKEVLIFNNYPDFFKPEYNHGSDPESAMVFRREREKGESSRGTKYGPDLELGNTIRHYPAKVKALDGKTLSDVIHDEIGKTHPKKEADVHTRMGVVAKSVYRNNVKRGIIRATSTIEEMKEGGDQALKIWKGSDPRYRDGNGYTVSKLYKYLVNGMEVMASLTDKYGRIDPVLAEVIIDNERLPLLNDPIELSKIIRKNPKNEEEAFLREQEDSPFDVFILTDVKNRLSSQKNIGRRGVLEYINGSIDSDVIFKDNPQGNFTVFRFPDDIRGDRKIYNRLTKIHTIDHQGKDRILWNPVNDDLFAGGSDPIKFVETTDKRASKMAAYGFERLDPLIDSAGMEDTWETHNLMWRYHARSRNPNDDYENVIKAMRYFGHRINCENNVSDFAKHCYSRGYWNMLVTRGEIPPEVLAGKSKNALSKNNPISTNKEVIDAYVSRIVRFLIVHGKRLKDIALVQQLLDFDPSDPTKYDLVVAFGYTLISLEARINPAYLYTPVGQIKPQNVMPMYDISGRHSKAINGTGYGNMTEQQDSIVIEIQQMLKNSGVI